MLQKLQKRAKEEKGFTIIEVLIVLAIAGLILLIVFLAVPALQRNSRNSQRKADVQALLGGATEFIANNAGALPTGYSNKELTGASGSTGAGVKVGYYTAVAVADGSAASVAALSTDTVRLVTGAKCDTTAGNIGQTVQGSARQISVQYMIEGTTGRVAACTDS